VLVSVVKVKLFKVRFFPMGGLAMCHMLLFSRASIIVFMVDVHWKKLCGFLINLRFSVWRNRKLV